MADFIKGFADVKLLWKEISVYVGAFSAIGFITFDSVY